MEHDFAVVSAPNLPLIASSMPSYTVVPGVRFCTDKENHHE